MHRYRITNIPSAILDQVGVLHATDHEVRAHFVPLMFLQGPVFLNRGALGLPKAKSW